MAYPIISDDSVLDAQVEIQGNDIRLYSRRGRTDLVSARNVDLVPGLLALLEQLDLAGVNEEAHIL